jgi:predicted nucleotidyltransferase component of viral defense system
MLHEDRYAFLAILNQIHDTSGVRLDILEKDYYVSLLLRELAEKQKELPAYFKGGTALYKAQKSIRRFSEDIDLTVSIENCSNSQAKKRLDTAAKKYTSLPRTTDKEMEEDHKGSITAVYDCDAPTDDFVGRGFARLVSLAGSTHTLCPLLRGSLL